MTIAVGDIIDWEVRGEKGRSKVVTVGKHGLWISKTSGVVGTGYMRIPFEDAKLYKTSGEVK